MLDALNEILNPQAPVCIALSGGVDSIVLAELAVRWGAQHGVSISAVHVNHGLSSNAQDWTDFVTQFCQQHKISLRVAHVKLERKPRESLEDIARKARYKALNELSPESSQILLAHHLDDQLETILLALKRGAGSLRLGGIAPVSNAGGGRSYVRPLLNAKKSDILNYAHDKGLSWVEDESNADSTYDRNFLRNEIIPALKNRWGGLLTATSRTSKILQSENRIVELHTQQVLGKITESNGGLNILGLSAITADERKLAIRLWIKGQGINPPREDRIDQIYSEVALARPDRTPLMTFPGAKITRKKGVLMLEKTMATTEHAPRES